MNLLSDAAQSETWPAIKPQLTEGKVCSFLLSSALFLGLENRMKDEKSKVLWLTIVITRPFTSPMVSPQSSKASPKSMCLKT